MGDNLGILLGDFIDQRWDLDFACDCMELLEPLCELGQKMLHRNIIESGMLNFAVI
jgi:hypothetical protein